MRARSSTVSRTPHAAATSTNGSSARARCRRWSWARRSSTSTSTATRSGSRRRRAALVAKAVSSERFAGGIVAVANNVASVLRRGHDRHAARPHSLARRLRARARARRRCVPCSCIARTRPTIVKRRFIESYFFTPMFEVYEINDNALGAGDDAALARRLAREIAAPRRRHRRRLRPLPDDVERGRAAARARSRFLALNAQANAGNRGYHRISKYRSRRLRVRRRERDVPGGHDWRGDLHPVVGDVGGRLGCSRVVVTLGKRGALCYERLGRLLRGAGARRRSRRSRRRGRCVPVMAAPLPPPARPWSGRVRRQRRGRARRSRRSAIAPPRARGHRQAHRRLAGVRAAG